MNRLSLVLLLIIVGAFSTVSVFAWHNANTIKPPEFARDAAIHNILHSHEQLKDLQIPSSWESLDLTPQGLLGLSKLQYAAGGWTVNVTYPVVWRPIYTVEIEYKNGIKAYWKGTVDQAGNVDENYFITNIDDHTVAWGREGDLELSMAMDKIAIFVGEEIEFAFTLTNKGIITLTFYMGPPFFDAYVYGSNGALVAKWTEGRGFPEYIKEITLEPGETFSETIQWDLYSYDHENGGYIPVELGQYGIVGAWLGETHVETTKTSVTVS